MAATRVVCSLAMAVMLSGAAAAMAGTKDLVKIRVSGRYYSEPATVNMTVAVEPNSDNRVLRVEADGDRFYRATELPLEGSQAPKHHMVSFKNVPSGSYTLRAYVLSRNHELALAETNLVVLSSR